MAKKKKLVSYKVVIRAGRKDERGSYLGYNVMVILILAAGVYSFYFLWKNPELASRFLTAIF